MRKWPDLNVTTTPDIVFKTGHVIYYIIKYESGRKWEKSEPVCFVLWIQRIAVYIITTATVSTACASSILPVAQWLILLSVFSQGLGMGQGCG